MHFCVLMAVVQNRFGIPPFWKALQGISIPKRFGTTLFRHLCGPSRPSFAASGFPDVSHQVKKSHSTRFQLLMCDIRKRSNSKCSKNRVVEVEALCFGEAWPDTKRWCAQGRTRWNTTEVVGKATAGMAAFCEMVWWGAAWKVYLLSCEGWYWIPFQYDNK